MNDEPGIHIHAPKATAKHVTTGVCPDCKKRTRFLGFFTPWYGTYSTCLRCGRQWGGGEWMPLDFVRQSRQKSVARAKRQWRRMPPVSENHWGLEY